MYKVLHINSVANSGSIGHIAEGIITHAQRRRYTCYLAYGRWGNKSEAEIYKIGSKREVYCHGFLSAVLDRHGLGSKAATRKLVDKIKELQPDIIHLHNIHGYYLNYPILFDYLSTLDIPIVWLFHDCWNYTGHCAYYSSKHCERWKTECHSCPKKLEYPKSYGLDASTANFRLKKKYFCKLKNLTIVTVSKWLASEVKESFMQKYPIRTIYNGIDLNIFRPLPFDKTMWPGKFVILGVATFWDERKGLDDFVALSKLLKEDEIIVLVGLSERQIRRMPHNIVGLNRTENVEKLVELYSRANLYINFSVEETFGMTTVESMACGTPAAVVNATASPEIINRNTELIIEPHDVAAVIPIINRIKQTNKSQYTEQYRHYVKERYEENERYEEYVDLYEQLIHDEDIDNHRDIQ